MARSVPGRDGNPLIGEDLGGLGVARVDDDGLQSVLVGQLHVVGRRAEPGDHRIHAPHDEELGVEEVGRLETGHGVLQAAGDLGEVNTEVQHLAGGMAEVECSPQAPKPASHQGASGKPFFSKLGYWEWKMP